MKLPMGIRNKETEKQREVLPNWGKGGKSLWKYE